jgi:hypothetical protein
MSKINWTRLLVGTIIAAVIAFLSDGALHELVLKADWKALYAALSANEPAEHGSSMVFFAIFELGRAFTAMLIYALLRGPMGAGPKTAVLAGVFGWIAFSLTGPVQFIPLGFFSTTLWFKAAAFQLVTSIISTVAGAAVYKSAS